MIQKTVAYTAQKNKKITSEKIPATVTIDGVTYSVTSIANSAFAKCKKLKNLVMGKNIVSIGDKAFFKCTALKKITLPANVKK